MKDKIKAISQVMCGIDVMCKMCGIKPHCEMTHEKATSIYSAHIKPLEDALEKVTEREKVLVEALERLARLGMGDRYGNSVGNCIAQDALASVKRHV